MNQYTLLLTFLLPLTLVGGEYENGRVFKKGDVVLEQWSPMSGEWQGVTLFYGFGLNGEGNPEMCEKAKEFFSSDEWQTHFYGRKYRCIEK